MNDRMLFVAKNVKGNLEYVTGGYYPHARRNLYASRAVNIKFYCKYTVRLVSGKWMVNYEIIEVRPDISLHVALAGKNYASVIGIADIHTDIPEDCFEWCYDDCN